MCEQIPSIEEVKIASATAHGKKNPATNCFYGNDAFNSPLPGRFLRRKACLKFYYRVVNESEQGGDVACQGPIGGEGVRDGLSAAAEVFGYREDMPNLLVGETCGMYIYVIDFFYWDSVCTSNAFWNSKGGAQFDENGNCQGVEVYGVDMFTVGRFMWP